MKEEHKKAILFDNDLDSLHISPIYELKKWGYELLENVGCPDGIDAGINIKKKRFWIRYGLKDELMENKPKWVKLYKNCPTVSLDSRYSKSVNFIEQTYRMFYAAQALVFLKMKIAKDWEGDEKEFKKVNYEMKNYDPIDDEHERLSRDCAILRLVPYDLRKAEYFPKKNEKITVDYFCNVLCKALVPCDVLAWYLKKELNVKCNIDKLFM